MAWNERGNILPKVSKVIAIVGAILIALIGIKGINKQIQTNLENEKLQLIEQPEQKTEVPEGYTGIYDSAGLKAMSENLSGKYILMNDIDMVGQDWEPIDGFKGIFDGNMHIIFNLTISSKRAICWNVQKDRWGKNKKYNYRKCISNKQLL